MNPILKLINKLDDYINPIVVKELRQMVRGKFFWSILMLFLAVQSIVLTAAISSSSVSQISAGRSTLSFLLGVLTFAAFGLIPLYSSFRFSKERLEKKDELLYITTITPHSIIRGKFFAAFIFVLVLISAFAPFLAMTFFLRGVDLPIVFGSLSIVICASAFAIIFQLCLACISEGSNTFSLMRGVGFITQFIAMTTLLGILTDGIRYGRLFRGVDWSIYASLFLIFLIACYFLYLASAAIISPAGSNRSLPVRSFVTAAWLVLLFLAIFIENTTSNVTPFWAATMIFIFSVFHFVSVCERDKISTRTAREIPTNPFVRIWYFLMSSGAANGLIWASIMQFITVIIVYSISSTTHGSSFREFSAFALGVPCYSLFYSLLASFIRRTFVSTQMDTKNTWVIALIAVAGLTIGPIIFGSIIGVNENILLFATPFALGNRSARNAGVIFAIFSSIALILANISWFTTQIAAFLKASRMRIKRYK